MIEVRAHRVMGQVAVSVWCTHGGGSHCLWSGQRWTDDDGVLTVLAGLRDGAEQAYQAVNRGDVDDVGDDCGL